jgi:hypothetical protein
VARSWSTRRRARARARARAPAPARARARAGAGAGVGAGDGRHQRGGAGSRRRSGGARPKDQARVPGRRRRRRRRRRCRRRRGRGVVATGGLARVRAGSRARTRAQRLSGLVHAEPAGHVPAARAQLALDCKALYMELLASQDHFERAQGACAACALMRARARLRGRCSGPGTAWALGPWCRQHGDMAQAMAAGSQSPCLCALSRRPRHEYEPGPHILAGRAHKHARAAHDLVQIARPLADAARTWPCSSSWPGTSTRGTSAFDRRTWSAPTQRFERTHASSTSPLARDSVVATSSHCALVPPEQTAVRPAGTRPRHATSGHVFGAAAGGGEGD